MLDDAGGDDDSVRMRASATPRSEMWRSGSTLAVCLDASGRSKGAEGGWLEFLENKSEAWLFQVDPGYS